MAVEIPNYRIIEKLGVGAQSRVFRARNMRDGSDYTIKIVKIIKPEDAGFVELLKAEHAIGTVINHPVIRKIYELRYIRRRLRVQGAILFMEYVPGGPLSYPDRRPPEELLRIFAEVAQGLHAMHLAGFVHADMKPNNILVNVDGTVKLIDLGQSAKLNEAKVKVQGTIDYMAPEQASRGKLDARTDVFGLGATLHRVLTGRPMATEMNQTVNVHSQSLVGKRVDQVRENMLELLPAAVARFIDDCCRNDPAHRIADMPGVLGRLEMLRTILNKHPVNAAEQTPTHRQSETSAEQKNRSSEPLATHMDLVQASGLFEGDEADLELDSEKTDGESI